MANVSPIIQKTCKVCGETKSAVQGTWVFKRGKPEGRTCLRCTVTKNNLSNATTAGKERVKANNIAARSKAKESEESWAKYLECQRKAGAKYRSTDIGRLKNNEAGLAWARNNPDKHNAKSMRRRAAELHRTPAWLTKADYQEIEDKYAIAKYFSELAMTPYHVDHIVPLQGEIVSGLHVPSNLCVRLGLENISKGNKWAS